jgi:hypothetical protein
VHPFRHTSISDPQDVMFMGVENQRYSSSGDIIPQKLVRQFELQSPDPFPWPLLANSVTSYVHAHYVLKHDRNADFWAQKPARYTGGGRSVLQNRNASRRRNIPTSVPIAPLVVRGFYFYCRRTRYSTTFRVNLRSKFDINFQNYGRKI